MNNSVDSDFSDSCYATMPSSVPVIASGRKGPLTNGAFAGLRGPVKVTRPGGGTESDAAFTPSPPVTNQQSMDSNVSLALAHQTRIRTLYSGSSNGPNTSSESVSGAEGPRGRRTDSSSSASSANDWEGSGHATILRRQSKQQQQPGGAPPMPQPRHKLPLVDSLGPLMPAYSNMSNLTAALGDILNGALDQSTSSDSEFERGFELMKLRNGPTNKKSSNGGATRKSSAPLLDRLSVRSESTGMMTTSLMNVPGGSGTNRRLAPVVDQEEGSCSTAPPPQHQQQKLYLSANEALLECFAECAPGTNDQPSSSKKDSQKILNTDAVKTHHHHHHQQQTLQLQPSPLSQQPGTTSHMHQKGDSIMMRQMNREMTPTISDVYHERSLGLGLAPSLSKLLLSKNYHEDMDIKGSGGAGGSSSSSSMKSTSTMIDSVNVADLDVSAVTQASTSGSSSGNNLCPMCNGTEAACTCNKIMTMATMVVTTGPAVAVKKPTSKPWLSNVNTNLVNASDLTTADILERQKFKSTSGAISGEDEIIVDSSCAKSVTGNESPQFSELSRRDEGDGRSVADSNCSGSFKIDQQQQQQNGQTNHKGGQGIGQLVNNAINVQK